MSLRRLFSHRRPSAEDNASQFSHAPTYRSLAELSPSPPSYTIQESDIPSSPLSSSNQHRDSWIPPNQPGQSVAQAIENFDAVPSHERTWSRGVPSIMSGHSGDERYWQTHADMSSIHSPPSSPIPPSQLYRSVYYRVYSPDGLMPTKQPASRDDPSLGRTYAHFVPPPHTAATLKRHLAVREGIGKDIASSLFIDIAASAPLEDTAIVTILGEAGVGSTPHDPLVLVLSEPDPARTMITETPTQLTNNSVEPPASAEPPQVGETGPVASAQSKPPRPTGWIRVLANEGYKRPSKGFMSYQRGEILYASTWQEMNDYGVIQRMATDMTLQRHGKIVMSFFTILKD